MKYITNLIKGIAAVTILTIAPGARAEKAAVPMKHSQAKTDIEMQSEIQHNFVQKAYETARLHSPFAAFNAEPAASAPVFGLDVLTNKMMDYAAKFLGTRYRLGATGPKMFDCSGFTSYVFRNFGISLNRTSRMQYTQGSKVSTREMQPGDLIFFSSASSGRGNVGHVGIVAEVNGDGTCKFIHASVKRGVTYQKFPDNGYFDRHFIGVKRVIEEKHLQAYK